MDRTQPPDETFTRRVCAVLLADVTGFSALMGEDDEGTVRAVRSLQRLVQQIVADANGRADAFAGDAIFAIFDSVVAAVDAALNMLRQIAAQEFAGRRLQVRIGVHYGDVLLREGAAISTAMGDAINVTARLQTLARAGTLCMSSGVYHQVHHRFHEKFIDLGRQQMKNIAQPVHAYLLVPRETELSHGTRRRLVGSLVSGTVLAALLTFAGVIAVRYWSTPAQKPEAARGGVAALVAPATQAAARGHEVPQVTLGVMMFKNLGGGDKKDWRREALRDGLNAQLSQLSHVKVYSREFIDFLMTRKGLSDVETASQLGIKKMLSGSYLVVGDTMRVEMHIVDVASGVIEASYTTMGREPDFLDIQNKLALGVISHLNLPVTAEEKRTLLAGQTTNLEALKLLLEAEGGTAAQSAEPAPTRSSQSESARPRWLALQGLGAGMAHAQNADTAAHEAILEVLESYRQATEAKHTQVLAAMHVAFSPEQQAAQERYFENVRDLHVRLDNIDVAVVGDEAVASYTRTDDFVDARTGRPMHVAVRLTKILRRINGSWKIAGTK